MLLIVLLFATLGYLLVKVGGYNSKRGRERKDLSKSLIVAGGPFYVKLSYKKNITITISFWYNWSGFQSIERAIHFFMYSSVPNNSPPRLINFLIFCRTFSFLFGPPDLLIFQILFLQIFQRLLKPIVLFAKL